jgi:two-component system, OmpR family, KDP operon response regulator KdpE
MINILVIDDEEQMRRLLRITFEASGFRVSEAATGKEGITQAAMVRPDAIVLDMGLPDMAGVEVLRSVRSWSSVPVIVLSVRGSEEDKVTMLDSGADDYVTKPFSPAELLARVRVALRHAATKGVESPLVRLGALEIDLAARTVKKHGALVKLTSTEYKILSLLVRHEGRVLTYSQILREVWGNQYADATHYVHVHVAALRRKIEENPSQPALIMTESGVGYRFRGRDVYS